MVSIISPSFFVLVEFGRIRIHELTGLCRPQIQRTPTRKRIDLWVLESVNQHPG